MGREASGGANGGGVFVVALLIDGAARDVGVVAAGEQSKRVVNDNVLLTRQGVGEGVSEYEQGRRQQLQQRGEAKLLGQLQRSKSSLAFTADGSSRWSWP